MTWDDWASEAEARQRAENEREHRTMVELLLARGKNLSAALVTASTYTSDCVDNWDGGQYEVNLGVPPRLFDRIDNETLAVLEAAARDVIRDSHFHGLSIHVGRIEPEPGWQETILRQLFESSLDNSGVLRALPVAGDQVA
jgi:hypothetical protein